MYGVWSNLKNEFQMPHLNNKERKQVWHLLLKNLGKVKIEKYQLTVREIKQLSQEELKPSSILKFGKHIGKKMSAVIEEDPGYVNWLLTNTNLTFHKDVEGILKIKMKEVEKSE